MLCLELSAANKERCVYWGGEQQTQMFSLEQ